MIILHCVANFQVFDSHAALKCPRFLFFVPALALVHCIVGAAARVPCIPTATTSVILHWGPSYAGGEGGWQPRGWTSGQCRVDAWSGANRQCASPGIACQVCC